MFRQFPSVIVVEQGQIGERQFRALAWNEPVSGVRLGLNYYYI